MCARPKRWPIKPKVRPIRRIAALDAVVVEQGFLVNQSGVGKIVVLLAHDGGLVEVPIAVALRGIDQGAAVLRERGTALGLRRMRDLLCGSVFVDARNEDLTARDKGNQLAVVAQREIACTLKILLHQLFLCLVVDDFDVHLLRLTANALCVDLPHVAIAQ